MQNIGSHNPLSKNTLSLPSNKKYYLQHETEEI